METAMARTAKSNTPKSKLDDAALHILKSAGEREDRLVFPLPESLGESGEKVEKIVKNLLTRKFIEEYPAKLEDTIWRTDEQQRHLTLRVSGKGLETIGAEETKIAKPNVPTKARKSPPPSKTSKAAQPRRRQATKAERILALLRRSQGTTLAELTKSTGWQVHSIRGFLSGTLKKRMKLKLKSERAEGKERRYWVA
jgi:hypothetical protein